MPLPKLWDNFLVDNIHNPVRKRNKYFFHCETTPIFTIFVASYFVASSISPFQLLGALIPATCDGVFPLRLWCGRT